MKGKTVRQSVFQSVVSRVLSVGHYE